MGLKDFEKPLSKKRSLLGRGFVASPPTSKPRALKLEDSVSAATTAATTTTTTTTTTTFLVDTSLPRSLNHPLNSKRAMKNPFTESCSDGSFAYDLPMLEVRRAHTSFSALRAPMLRRAWEPWQGVGFMLSGFDL